MKTHLRSMAKRKVSDFLLREEGMVGNRSAFATAALVSTTALAMTLLVTSSASGAWCPGINCNFDGAQCCNIPGGSHYTCVANALPPPYVCWD